MAAIVVIDDEYRQRDILKTILEDEGYEVHTASSAEEGLELIDALNPDVVITDLKMGGMSGVHLLECLPVETKPAVIIMTAFGTISSAVEAMKKGAFDYLTKPLEKDVIVLTVRKAMERMQLLRENLRLQDALFEKFKMEGIIGTSRKMREAAEIAKKVTPTAVTVLVYGESGTGKELIAKAIHYNSPRRTGPFTAINCAAIPDTLIESELFGYEPGAFSGAVHRKIGLFESSDKGTLFLDEVGDLPLLTQTKILRVLQDKEVRRLGGKENTRVDVRIIAATNKDLEKEVAAGKFREDLYYRLKVVTVTLPPLRERKEDIPALVSLFIDKYNREFGKRIKGVSESALRALGEYHWPGNIRQLESVIERAVLMGDSDMVGLNDIRSELKLGQEKGVLDIEIPDEGINFEELEKELIKKAMFKANNVAARAARLLGMTYKTFWYRLEKFGIQEGSPNEDTLPEKRN
ncbi:MAG: sigma-54 dependent transcriptional regulator [Alphaproteobacteria bacterium]|uniref:Sigma-54 dependent transcriptional regulator n=1 Tax=Candidatus Nitrobium versatile TaxID=2884831 RepID=A0A953J6Z6_9BACT|nr:sigma-54 dependent transcriptional regulator [Candidatus Nitrobium versatile]